MDFRKTLETRKELLEKAAFQNTRQVAALEAQLSNARNEGIALAGALMEIEHLLAPEPSPSPTTSSASAGIAR